MTSGGLVIGTSAGPGVPLLLNGAPDASSEASWNNGSDVSVVVNNVCDAGGRLVVVVVVVVGAVVTSAVDRPAARWDCGGSIVVAGAGAGATVALAAGFAALRLLLLLYCLMTNSSNFACDTVESVSVDAGCRKRNVRIERGRNI